MELLEKILLVVFVIVSVILVLLVLVQDDGQNGMGGLLGGRGTAAFGSHSANVLTKSTVVLVVLFFVLALGLAYFHRVPAEKSSAISEQAKVQAELEGKTAEVPADAAVQAEREDW